MSDSPVFNELERLFRKINQTLNRPYVNAISRDGLVLRTWKPQLGDRHYSITIDDTAVWLPYGGWIYLGPWVAAFDQIIAQENALLDQQIAEKERIEQEEYEAEVKRCAAEKQTTVDRLTRNFAALADDERQEF